MSRIREALRYVEPERLLIAPDCGLMTISRDLARRKAELLVAAAREVDGLSRSTHYDHLCVADGTPPPRPCLQLERHGLILRPPLSRPGRRP